MRRRDFLPAVAAATSAAMAQPAVVRKGRIKQGVRRAVFARGASIDDCCREAARPHRLGRSPGSGNTSGRACATPPAGRVGRCRRPGAPAPEAS